MVQQNLQIRFLARIGEEIQEIEKKKKKPPNFINLMLCIQGKNFPENSFTSYYWNEIDV